LRRAAQLAFAAVVAFALVTAQTPETFLGFMAILTVASIPFFVWIKRGAMQLPILPCVALFYVPSYANATSLMKAGTYTPDQILVGELTVALFLGAAVLAWLFFPAERRPRALNRAGGLDMGLNPSKVMFLALVVGAVFEVGGPPGWWSWMGTFYGTFRTFASSTTLIGFFLYGAALGKRSLSPEQRVLGGILLALILGIEMSSLYLYTAMLYFITVCLGYFLLTRKIPWAAIILGCLIATTLHSAKGGMRVEYWGSGMQSKSTGLSDIPGMMEEWVGAGINNMIFGAPEDQQDLSDRASMLPNLLLAQQNSPQRIPYLYGETYANFWGMLTPRFLAPSKIISQTNLAILSIHYGLQTTDDTATTTISWGLVSEAYANFGFAGVVVAGLAFGALLGWLTYLTTGAPVISARGFIGLVSLIIPITSVAYDFSYMLLNLIQGIVAMLIVSLAFQLPQSRVRRRKALDTSRMNVVHT
jgi:hypothetical protein